MPSYYGDCLEIMRQFPNNYVDLICLDPPFNSNEKYNTIFKGKHGLTDIEPQIKAFDDTWQWNDAAAKRVEEVKGAVANPASKVIQAFELCIPQSKMLSYTSYMAQRLMEMWRVLKDAGSIYLHCDPYASHYLKVVMDAIFGDKNFRNEIVWCYTGPSNTKRWYPRKHDILLFYGKDNPIFNCDEIRIPYAESTVERSKYGGKPSGGMEFNSRKMHPSGGKIPEDWWSDIYPIKHYKNENLGYPTQKPVSLYERIIRASSNVDDLVLDPFCGCGTTIAAARNNNRSAIGIDILPFALRLINQHRLVTKMPVYGIPVDMQTATELAKSDHFKFQDWALSLIDGLAANPQKVGDDGIDGFGMLLNKPDNMDKKGIVVQVTGATGAQYAKYDRLQNTIRKHSAAIGILITLTTQPSHRWRHDLDPVRIGESSYESIQCFSIEEYYKHGEKWRPILTLPSLTNPWTGKAMQPTLFDN